jgi:hypothetical protein
MELNGKKKQKKGVLPSSGEQRERERPSEYGVEEKLFFVILLAKALDKETTGWQAFDR